MSALDKPHSRLATDVFYGQPLERKCPKFNEKFYFQSNIFRKLDFAKESAELPNIL